MTIQQELIEIVKKNLPEAQAQAMKEFVDDYEKVKSKLVATELELEESNKTRDNYLENLNKMGDKVNELLKTEDQLRLREQAVSARENAVKEVEYKQELAATQKELSAYRQADAKISDFFNLVFKNTTYRKTYSENNCLAQSWSDQYGNARYNWHPISRNTTEEHIEE